MCIRLMRMFLYHLALWGGWCHHVYIYIFIRTYVYIYILSICICMNISYTPHFGFILTTITKRALYHYGSMEMI